MIWSQFITNWLSTLTAETGASISLAASIGSLYYVGVAAGNVIIGQFTDRWGLKMVAIGFLIAVPVSACVGFASATLPLLAIAILCIAVLLIGLLNGIYAASGMLYSTAMRSSGVEWANGIGRVGSILGPVVGGILISLNMPISKLLLLLAMPVALAAMFVAWLMRTVPRA